MRKVVCVATHLDGAVRRLGGWQVGQAHQRVVDAAATALLVGGVKEGVRAVGGAGQRREARG